MRQEEARLLGFVNFGEVSVVPKMAESPQEVITFLRDLSKKARPYAEKDVADLRAFAADVTADQSVLQTRDTRLAALAYPLYPTLPDALMDDATLKPIEDDLVSRFLLSSDFFWNGADEATPVAYLGYYIPGRSPCFNPLLRPGSNAD